ncbi:MAG: LysR substrate-binding domain-containing protein [Pseudomonadota bacterium]
MTLTELRYIVAVAREKHFGRAADACYVSQPTLSVAIRKLEDQLGLQLFERSKTSIKVTPKGLTIIAQAQRVLEEAEKIKQIAEESHDQLEGIFRLGAVHTIGPYLLPNLVKQAKLIAPKMPLILEEDFTVNLRKKLRNGDLDAIIVALPFNEAEVNAVRLYKEPFVALLPQEHSRVQQDSISVKELLSSSLLLLGQGHCFRDQIIDHCLKTVNGEANDVPSQQLIEGSSLETIRQMVGSGIGVSILPISACQPLMMENTLVVCRPMDSIKPSRTVAIAYRQSFPRIKAIELLIQAIRRTDIFGVEYLNESAL